MSCFSARCLPVVAVVLSYLSTVKPAHAYIDPGTGSYMLQLAIAGAMAAAFAIGSFWRRIREYLRAHLPNRRSGGHDQD